MKYKKQIAAANMFLDQYRKEINELTEKRTKDLELFGKVSDETNQLLESFKKKIQKANKMRTF